MDEQKKQKVLIGVLAVLALGAGGYYFVLREPASNNVQAKATGPVERRVRKAEADPGRREKKVSRKRKTREKNPIADIVRRERKKGDTKKAERRTRRGPKKTKVKKKELAPAA